MHLGCRPRLRDTSSNGPANGWFVLRGSRVPPTREPRSEVTAMM